MGLDGRNVSGGLEACLNWRQLSITVKSVVDGSSLSGIVRGGTDILDIAQCLGVRKRIRMTLSWGVGVMGTRRIKLWGGGAEKY